MRSDDRPPFHAHDAHTLLALTPGIEDEPACGTNYLIKNLSIQKYFSWTEVFAALLKGDMGVPPAGVLQLWPLFSPNALPVDYINHLIWLCHCCFLHSRRASMPQGRRRPNRSLHLPRNIWVTFAPFNVRFQWNRTFLCIECRPTEPLLCSWWYDL